MLILVLMIWTLMMEECHMTPDVVADYCEDATFQPDCGEGEVIVMQEARYGRMKVGSCLTTNYGSTGCSSDVLQVIDKLCSGRKSCEVPVRDLLVKASLQCPSDLRSYLMARYTCVPVVSPNSGCCQTESHVKLTESSGFIASSVTETTGCGSIDCPWLIEAPKGQNINISLYDFGVPERTSGIMSDQDRDGFDSVCHVYAIIKEEDIGSTMTLCGGEARTKNVYVTATNKAQVRIVTKNKKQDELSTSFMLQYKAMGCADIKAPSHGRVTRSGNRAEVQCLNGDSAPWKLICQNGKWRGTFGNCTEAGNTAGLLENILLTPDISIVIIALVAVTIALGILVVGVFCLRKRWLHQGEPMKKPPQNPEAGAIDPRRNSNYVMRNDNKNNSIIDSTLPREPQHNYFRTWELQRHQAGRHAANQDPVSHQQDENYMSQDTYNRRYADHIYESPTFARKEVGEDGAQYYELDPEAEPFQPTTVSYRDANANSTNAASLPKQRCSYPGMSDNRGMAGGNLTS